MTIPMLKDKVNIWLDCDTGHDDAFALLLAGRHPRANLLGVSTVHGNASIEHTTHNTCAILEALGLWMMPVVRGAWRPLDWHRKPIQAPQYHGESGLDGVTLLPELKHYNRSQLPEAPSGIYRQLFSRDYGSVWIVATGPLTNIAKLLTEYPDAAKAIRGISIMGGAVGGGFTDAPMHRQDGPGNWTRWAEFNILCDPEAARIVLSHPTLSKRTVFCTLDLTHQCQVTEAIYSQLFPPPVKPNPPPSLRRMMQEVMVYFRESYKKHSPHFTDGPPLHDAVAVFAVLDFVYPNWKSPDGHDRYDVDVILEGEEVGRTVLKASDPEVGGVLVPKAIDLVTFWDEIRRVLTLADYRLISKDFKMPEWV